MSENAPDGITEPVQDWPTHCPDCGTELESATIDMDESKADRPEMRPGEMVAVDFCPNPDCPSKKPGASGDPGEASPQ
jgi:hypothetical protein